MVSFNKVNSVLSTFDQRLPRDGLLAAGNQVVGEYNAQLTSKLGGSQGEILNGIQALTSVADYPGQFGDNVFGTATIKLTDAVDGFTSSLVTDIASLFSGGSGGHSVFTDVLNTAAALAAVTQGGPASGYLQSYFAGSGGESIQRLLGTATGKPISQLLSVVSTVQAAGSAKFIQNAMKQALGATLGPVISEFNVRANLTIGTALGSTLQNIVDALDTPVVQIISGLTQGKLKTAQLNTIARLIENGNYTGAIAAVAGVSTLPIGEIESGINGLSTKLSDRVTYGNAVLTLPNFDIGSNAQGWDGVRTNTPNSDYNATLGSSSGSITGGGSSSGGGSSNSEPYNFTYIAGSEELEAEMRSSSREITEVVIHWTATFMDQDIGSEEVHQWHLARGFSGCGYHYIIRRDGRLQRGRPIGKTGAHAKENGHNNKSIGISLAGGYTCVSGTSGYQNLVGKESFTTEQNKAMNEFLATFYKVFPGGQAFGHSDTDPGNKIDPGFSVPSYVTSVFNKNNITTGTSAPLTVAQISTARSTATV